jgi:hypothetical protein
MTFTDELLEKLELLSSKATQGKWWIDSHGHTMIATDTLDVVFSMPSTKGAVRHPETGNLSSWRNDWDASYIAAANPKNMQMLLTEIRRLRAENAELGGLLREAGKTIHQLQSEQPTPLRIARYLDAMRAKIDAAMRATQ